MKINLSFFPQEWQDFKSHSLLQGLEFDADNNEVEEIRALDVLEYLPVQAIEKVFQYWHTKLAHKGTLTIDFVDFYTLSRLFFLQQIRVEQVNDMLHGHGLNGWDIKKTSLTLPQVCMVLEKIGYKILSKRLDGLKGTIIAERP